MKSAARRNARPSQHRDRKGRRSLSLSCRGRIWYNLVVGGSSPGPWSHRRSCFFCLSRPSGEALPKDRIMAEDFDYVSFWESARDVLDVLEALGNAKLPLLSLSGSWAVPGFPPAFNEGKRPKPPNYSERYRKAIDAIRKAGAALVSLLAEKRFELPLHGVWPPSAPREITGRFSLALRIARTAFNETDPSKSNPESAQYTVRAVVTELERRWADLAECAYQRDRDRLQCPPAVAAASPVTPPATAPKSLAVEQQAPAVVAAGAASVPTLKPPNGRNRPRTNDLMILELERNPEAKGWTIRQWKVAIGRSTSSIHDADQWRQLKAAHDLVKAERAMHQERLRGLNKKGIDRRGRGRNID